MAHLLAGSDAALAPFTLLHAPAGYGKTTLAAQVTSVFAPGMPRVVRVRPTASSPSSFWTALLAGLSAGDASSVGDENGSAWEMLIERVATLTEPILLVVDSYHRVSDAETDLALLELSGASEHLHLLVLARRVKLLDGPLCADRVRSIGAADLAFTEEELSDLATRFQTELTGQVKLALARTGGWPLAASAVLRSDSRSTAAHDSFGHDSDAAIAPAKTHPGLARFAEDSLELLTDQARAILLAASVVETISLEQAAIRLGQSELEALHHVRTLLELGLLSHTKMTHRKVYRAHPAVRQTLAAIARRSYSELDRATLVRGSARERAEQDPLSAFHMFLETSALAEAEEVLAANFTALTDDGESCTRALMPLSDEILQAYPTFAAARLFVKFSDRTVSPETLHHLAQLMHSGAGLRLKQGIGPESTLSIAHRMQVMVGERMHGNVPGALAIALGLEPLVMSHAHAKGNDLSQGRADGRGTQPAFLEELGFTAFMGGDSALARRVWQRLEALMRVPSGSPQSLLSPHATTRHAAGRLAALYGLAIVDANEGDFVIAAEHIAEADKLQKKSGISAPALSWVNGEVARAHLSYEHLDEDMLHRAIQRISPWRDRIEQWPLVLMAEVEATRYRRGPDWAIPHLRSGIAQVERARHGVGIWGGYLALYQAVLHTTLGDFTVSRRILRSLPAENLFVQIEQARLSLFSGDNVRALLEVQKIGLPGISKRQRIDKFLIAAVAAWSCGQNDEAFEALRHASELIERCGLSMMLRTVPFEPLREVALAAQAAGICDLVERVDSVPEQVRSVVRERLTGMEQRALETMVSHPTLVAAAELLSIAQATLKRHRLAVYRKLQVGGRKEAILQATRMGLLAQ